MGRKKGIKQGDDVFKVLKRFTLECVHGGDFDQGQSERDTLSVLKRWWKKQNTMNGRIKVKRSEAKKKLLEALEHSTISNKDLANAMEGLGFGANVSLPYHDYEIEVINDDGTEDPDNYDL